MLVDMDEKLEWKFTHAKRELNRLSYFKICFYDRRAKIPNSNIPPVIRDLKFGHSIESQKQSIF